MNPGTSNFRDPTPLPEVPKVEVRDPWGCRSDRMKCKTCMWFVKKLFTIGRCRRHSPTLSGYPVVYQNDWCGDHKLNEK